MVYENHPTGPKNLLEAVRENDIEKIRKFAKRKGELESRDMYGMTPLIGAAMDGNVEAVKILLEAGADVNAQDNSKRTALIYASIFGHSEIARILLDYGADTRIADELGMTAEMWCISQKNILLLNLILRREGRPFKAETIYYREEIQ